MFCSELSGGQGQLKNLRLAIAAIVGAEETCSSTSKTKTLSQQSTCRDRIRKNNPAVPPRLTPARPLNPYQHTVALVTECRSVAHRAGNPPSDCPPKSIHTIQSVPRSQQNAALCDTLGSVTYSSSTVSYEIAWILLRYFAKVKIFFEGARGKKKRAPENRSSLVTRTGFEPMLPP